MYQYINLLTLQILIFFSEITHLFELKPCGNDVQKISRWTKFDKYAPVKNVVNSEHDCLCSLGSILFVASK